MSRFTHEDPLLNGLILGNLIDLNALETVDLMERAFEAGAVDLGINGDWEDVQLELGLIAERTTPRPLHGSLARMIAQGSLKQRGEAPHDFVLDPPPSAPVPTRGKAKKKSKARGRMAKASRRRNRRRR